MSKEFLIPVAGIEGFLGIDRLKRALLTLQGVLSVDARLDAGSGRALVRIEYDEKLTKPDRVKKELNHLGFKVAKDKKLKISVDTGSFGCPC